MLLILAIDFKEVTKTSFVSKLKAHPGKVHIAIVVGTRNVGHLERCGAIADRGQRQQYRDWNVFPVVTCSNPGGIAQTDVEVLVR